MTNSTDNFSEIDERKLSLMKVQIMEAERSNNNTKARTKDGMIDLILQTIKNIANRTY